MTRETLDKLRGMGMVFGPEYDVLTNTLEASRKADADNARITKIEYKPDTQKKDGNQHFIVKVTVSSEQFQNIVEVEIDGRQFIATRKSTVFEQNAFYANVFVDFSTVVSLDENFTITVRLKDLVLGVLDTRTKPLTVKSGGSVDDGSKANKETKEVIGKPTKSITIEQLIAFGVGKKKATEYLDSLNQTFVDYEINTDVRIIHFLSQVLHESLNFIYTVEQGVSDDHYKGFKGRGLMQITWEENYNAYEDYESEDFTSSLKNKEKLEKLPYSIRSAGWFWSVKSELNEVADKNDFIYSSYIINGGFNGFDIRKKHFKKGFKALDKSYLDFQFKQSKINNIKKACFAWGLWHDPDVKSKMFDTCESNKDFAIEGYKRFLDLVTANNNSSRWYGIQNLKEFENFKFVKNKVAYVKIIDAVKERIKKLSEV